MRNRAPAAEWRVRLYGDPALMLPEGRSVALERRAAALLALAALEPGVSRLRAASMLWPDSADPRRNLRQQLLRFRQTFERELLVGSDTLSLAPGLVADTDAEPTGAVLLGPHDYSDCEDFAAWVSLQRTGRRERRLAALRQQGTDAEAAGDLDAALTAANALLALDAHVENYHRELMRLHYLRGDTAAGLAAYRHLSDMLAADHGTRPSAASEQLAEILRANRQQHERANTALASAISRQTLPVTLKRPPLLAGRENERAAVLEHWAAGRAVLLEGEAGLGKSRLMAELLSGHGTALRTAGRPGDAGAPYATLARLLRPLLDDAGDGSAVLDVSSRETLAHIAPAVASAAATVLPALRPGAMAAAVSALLQQRSVPLVAIDDLHFADEATLDLIAGLVAPADPPRRWLLAGRPAELPAAAQTLRSSLAELLRLSVVTLAALDESAIGALVDGLAIHGLQGSALAAPLWRHTGGNPLFVLETLKQGLADGSLARGELPRPIGVGSLIERRLQRLSEPALTLARVAAIAGVDFSIELAEAAIGVRAVQLASAWSELQDAQVLRDESFAHDLVCDAVLRILPAPIARHLHAATAHWLDQHQGEPARIARHWAAARQPERALPAWLQAADRAATAMRHVEALAMYEEARCIHAANGRRIEESLLLLRMSESLRYVDDAAATDRVLSRMLEVAEDELGRARAYLAAARAAFESRRVEEAIGHGEQALVHARAAGDAEAIGRIRTQMAMMLADRMQIDDAQAHIDAVREWAGGTNPDQRFMYHFTSGWIALMREDFAVSVAEFERSLDPLGGTSDPGDTAQTYGNIAVAYAGMGAMRQALVFDERRRDLVARHELAGTSQAYLELNAATLMMAVGRYREADAYLIRAEERGAPDASMLYLRWATLMFFLGQHARALRHLDRADAAEGGYAIVKLAARTLRAQVSRAIGAPVAGAPDMLANADALAASDGRSAARVRAALARAEFGDPAEAAHHARLAATLARERGHYGLQLAAQTLLLERAVACGQAADAQADVRRVLVLRETYESHAMYRARVGLAAWRALARSGDATAPTVLAREREWILATAEHHVPPAYRDSFVHRNPVNRDLLAAAGGSDR